MKEIFNKQKEIDIKIQNEYKLKNYTIDNPYIIVNPYGLTPLTGLIKFKNSGSTKYIITIEGEFSYSVNANEEEQEIILVGLYANRKNKIQIEAVLYNGEVTSHAHYVIPNEIPDEFSKLDVTVSKETDSNNGFISLCLAGANGSRPLKNLYSAIDYKGNIRWVYLGKSWYLFKKLCNGNILVDSPISEGEYEKYSPNGVVEINALGKYIEFYPIENGSHHDVYEMKNGNLLALTQNEDSVEDVVIEIDRKTKKVIDSIDFKKILDINRETVIDKKVINDEKDWLHLNSIIYDEQDDSIIVSARNQSLVCKINKSTREIVWIIAPKDNWKKEYEKYLFKPIGENFEWSWSLHTVIKNGNNFLVFDNGNYRSFDLKKAILASSNYSRAVEYKIDTKNMTIEQVWQYGKERGSLFHCPFLSGVKLLPNGNRLICFGGTAKDRFGNSVDDMKSPRVKNRVYIVEVTCDIEPKVVFEASFVDNNIMTSDGFLCYRADNIEFV